MLTWKFTFWNLEYTLILIFMYLNTLVYSVTYCTNEAQWKQRKPTSARRQWKQRASQETIVFFPVSVSKTQLVYKTKPLAHVMNLSCVIFTWYWAVTYAVSCLSLFSHMFSETFFFSRGAIMFWSVHHHH